MDTKVTIPITFDPRNLTYTDEHLAALWYVAMANPVNINNQEAGEIAELIGREIIHRWLKNAPVPLWNHQGRHYTQGVLLKHGCYVDGEWLPYGPLNPRKE